MGSQTWSAEAKDFALHRQLSCPPEADYSREHHAPILFAECDRRTSGKQ